MMTSEIWQEIKGNAIVRRALEIAYTGKHSITVWGNVRNMPEGLSGIVRVVPLCPCGNYGEVSQPCWCRPSQLRRYWRSITVPTDIHVSYNRPSWEEMCESVEPWSAVTLRMDQARTVHHVSLELSHECLALLRSAYERYFFSYANLPHILHVAITCSKLAGEYLVSAAHIAEAISYARAPHHTACKE